MMGFNYIWIYRAEQLITSGLVAVLFSTLVFMSPVAMRLAFGTPLRVRTFVAATFGVTGVALLFLPELRQAQQGGAVAFGIALTLAATASAAVGNLIAVRNHRAGFPTLPATAWGLGYGSLLAAGRCDRSGHALDVRRAAALRAVAALPVAVRQRDRVRRLLHAAQSRGRGTGLVHDRLHADHRDGAVHAVRGLPLGLACRRWVSCSSRIGTWLALRPAKAAAGKGHHSSVIFASTISFFQFARSVSIRRRVAPADPR